MAFTRSHDLDIVFLQEVTIPAILNTTGYATHLIIWGKYAWDGHTRETRLSSHQRHHTTVGVDQNGIRLVRTVWYGQKT
jgi:hypothetical protein